MGYFYHKYFIVLILWLASLLLPSAVWAAQIRLAWDPNTESDLAGYKVYYGMGSGVYGSPINVGNVTTYTLTNLTLGQTYFIAVTAYNASNNESGYSNEVRGDATELGQTCTVATSPSGLQVVVDGATYTAPQTFSWNPGSSYTVSVSSPQSGGAGVQYVYSSWSDGGGQSHTITAPSSSTTYTANFTTQYSLATSASPSGGGTASPSGTNWYNSGQAVSVSATANAGYSFSNWTGDLSGSTNPTSLAMSGPKSVTANFAAIPETVSTPTTPSGPTNGVIGTSYSYSTGGASSNLGHSVEYQFDWKGDGTDLSPWGSATRSKTWTVAGTYQVKASARCISHTSVVSSWSNALSVSISAAAISCTVATSPSGLQVVVDGATYTASQTFSWNPGSSHTVSVSSPQSGGSGVQYVYSSWSDGGGQSHTITAPSSTTTYMVNFTTQYSLTTSASPSGGGTANPSGTNWYNNGQTVSVSATPNAGYSFTSWTGDVSGSTNPASVTMNRPQIMTANFTPNQYTLAVNVSPAGVGSVTKSPDKGTYVYGEQVQLTATGSLGYTFSNWSGDSSGTANPVTITINGNKTVTADFLYSFRVLLKPGYNLVSFPTVSGEIAIGDLLSSIPGKYEIVYAYEGCDLIDHWKIYDPALPAYVNNLQYVDSAMGIWIKANQDAELTVEGLFPSVVSVPLCAGWNLISYAGEQAKPLAEALSSISGKYEIVYAYRTDDVTDPWKIYDVSVPSYVNDLGTMEPGLGYWIYITENCTLAITN